jgi:hypothetical protein
MKKQKYYEALTKSHDIVRFWADNDFDAIDIAHKKHYCSVIRIKYSSLIPKETILEYRDGGY